MKFNIILLSLLLIVAASACGRNKSATPQSLSAEIKMTADGFEPAELAVKKGTQVIFTNTDTKPHWPESDLPGFDSLQGVALNQTYSFSFTQVGQWEYKDHLNPDLKGSVMVTE